MYILSHPVVLILFLFKSVTGNILTFGDVNWDPAVFFIRNVRIFPVTDLNKNNITIYVITVGTITHSVTGQY